MNRLACMAGLTLSLLATMASAAEPATIRLAAGASVAWSAVPPDESLGTSGAMLYPAPSAGGLLAAILTHSILVDHSRSSEREQRKAQAEQSLQPLRPAIAALDDRQLLQRAQAHLDKQLPGGTLPGPLEVVPVYAVLTDHRAIVIDAVIQLGNTAGKSDGKHPVRVQVVSSAVHTADPTAHWLANDGAVLREEAGALLGHAIEVAVRHARRPAAETPARTQRYVYGSDIRMERGQAVAKGCARVVLFTLREHWMSVPLPPGSEGSTCEDRFRVDGG